MMMDERSRERRGPWGLDARRRPRRDAHPGSLLCRQTSTFLLSPSTMTTAAAAPSTMASSSSSIAAKELDPYRDLPQSLRVRAVVCVVASRFLERRVDPPVCLFPLPPRQTTRLLFSTSAPSTPTTLSDLLSLAPSTIAARVTSRSVPLTNPPRVSSHSTAKQRAKVRRAKDAIRKGTIGLLPRAELKRRGVWQPRPGELSWTSLGGLRDLWEGYAVELLGLKSLRLGETWEGNPEGLQAKLIKADFTGAYVKGASSRCEDTAALGQRSVVPNSLSPPLRASFNAVTAAANISLVGIEGIVLHETEQTFKLFTQSSTLKGARPRCSPFKC